MSSKPPKDKPQPGPDGHEGDDAVIGRAFRRSLIVIVALAVTVGITVFLLTRPKAAPPTITTPLTLPEKRERVTVEIPAVKFTNITDQAGIKFQHSNGATGQKLLPETMGSGCAFLDYDNDDDQDLLFINSCNWPWDPVPNPPPTMVLYQNDGKGNFTNVTAGSGLDVTFYGMGVAVGDYDNDGWVDLFISAVGRNRLFHNEQGKFVDVTEPAGVGGDEKEWSTGCGWFDYNHDGRLDLFVCNYVRWSKDIDLGQDFRLVGVGRAYGPPTSFEGTFPYLYRNEGDGKFTDVSEEAGLQIKNPATDVPMAKSLGLAFVDVDRDGWLDVIVANDTVQNFLYHNRQDGKFQEIGAPCGLAFDSGGSARGAMGIDAGFFRNDDALGIAIGNFANEMSALYVSQGASPQFTDEAISTGFGPPTRLELSFGMLFFDYDLDGRLDLAAANGHLEDDIHKVQASQQHAQPPHLFWNCGPGQRSEFLAVPTEKVGSDYYRPMVGRGTAYADIDGDGDLDLVMTENHGQPRLLRNDQQLGHHWVRFKLKAAHGQRDAIGAWIEVPLADGMIMRRQVMPTRSYLSQVELPVTIGLGALDTLKGVRVIWPDGSIQPLADVQVDALNHVTQEVSSGQ
jgi:hypothetical protein